MDFRRPDPVARLARFRHLAVQSLVDQVGEARKVLTREETTLGDLEQCFRRQAKLARAGLGAGSMMDGAILGLEGLAGLKARIRAQHERVDAAQRELLRLRQAALKARELEKGTSDLARRRQLARQVEVDRRENRRLEETHRELRHSSDPTRSP
ncbi:MAG: hypothetical protein HY815_24265 [Candidatus Riflebacteria bacterium]|nr:hypothetical protein [Candidatus Riflebacteria bacterium]